MQPPSDTFSIGSLVSIEGLQANPELNGRTGVTLAFTEESGRWSVQIDASDKGPAVQKSIRPINLKVLPQSPLPSAPALHAESERNRLYKRCCECGAPATSFCDSCKVAPYCSSKCQQAHLPRHMAACVAYVKHPENRDAVTITLKLVKKLTKERAFPHDWEHPYSYIFIRPVPDSLTWTARTHSTIAAVEGIVEANLPLPNLVGEITTDALNARFQWKFTGSNNIVRGYSHEDAFALRAWTSDSFDPQLPPNQMGQQLTFVTGVRGGVVVQKFDSQTYAVLPITRREVWEIAELLQFLNVVCKVWEIATVRGEGGRLGLLNDRMMRENARRREMMAVLTEFGVQVLDSSPGSGAGRRQPPEQPSSATPFHNGSA